MKRLVTEYILNNRNQLVIRELDHNRACMCYQQDKVCSDECAAFQYSKTIDTNREYVFLHCIAREIELSINKEDVEEKYRDLDLLTDTIDR